VYPLPWWWSPSPVVGSLGRLPFNQIEATASQNVRKKSYVIGLEAADWAAIGIAVVSLVVSFWVLAIHRRDNSATELLSQLILTLERSYAALRPSPETPISRDRLAWLTAARHFGEQGGQPAGYPRAALRPAARQPAAHLRRYGLEIAVESPRLHISAPEPLNCD